MAETCKPPIATGILPQIGSDDDLVAHSEQSFRIRSGPLEDEVACLGVQGNSPVGRECPWGCGPDRVKSSRKVVWPDFRKQYRGRQGTVVFIFDFGVRQGRFTIGAPQDRFDSLVHPSVTDDARKCFQNVGFVAKFHREIRVVPIRKNPHSLEFFFLDFHIF